MAIGKRVAAACALAALVALVVPLATRPGKAQEPDTARVSDLKGRLAVHGDRETAVSYLQRNAVVRQGDTLWTDRGGQAEVEFPGGGWVRLAEETKIEILSIARAPELRLWNGAAYCHLRSGFDGPLTLRTPDGDVEVAAGSIMRVEVVSTGRCGVKVFLGSASVAPLNGEPVLLEKGQRCALESGRLAGEVAAFDPLPPADGFDRYETSRVGYLNHYPEPEALRPLVGAYELAGHGDWIRHEGRDYWRPVQEEHWRPYSEGYWSFVHDEGPCWVDSEPWGYTTSHYGRWDYLDEYNDWCWEPDDCWAPAHVAWGGYDNDYIGWAPLGPRDPYYGWGGPEIFLSFWHDDRPDDRCWSFAPRDDFYYCRPAYHHEPCYHSVSECDSWGGGKRFHPIHDVCRDWGAPTYDVRGLTVDPYGYSARDTVLRVEQQGQRGRYGSFSNRFGVAPDRDLRLARAITPVEAIQRFRGNRLAQGDVVRGEPAAQRYGGAWRRSEFAGGPGRRERITLAARDRGWLQQAGPPGPRVEVRDGPAVRQRVAGWRSGREASNRTDRAGWDPGQSRRRPGFRDPAPDAAGTQERLLAAERQPRGRFQRSNQQSAVSGQQLAVSGRPFVRGIGAPDAGRGGSAGDRRLARAGRLARNDGPQTAGRTRTPGDPLSRIAQPEGGAGRRGRGPRPFAAAPDRQPGGGMADRARPSTRSGRAERQRIARGDTPAPLSRQRGISGESGQRIRPRPPAAQASGGGRRFRGGDRPGREQARAQRPAAPEWSGGAWSPRQRAAQGAGESPRGSFDFRRQRQAQPDGGWQRPGGRERQRAARDRGGDPRQRGGGWGRGQEGRRAVQAQPEAAFPAWGESRRQRGGGWRQPQADSGGERQRAAGGWGGRRRGREDAAQASQQRQLPTRDGETRQRGGGWGHRQEGRRAIEAQPERPSRAWGEGGRQRGGAGWGQRQRDGGRVQQASGGDPAPGRQFRTRGAQQDRGGGGGGHARQDGGGRGWRF